MKEIFVVLTFLICTTFPVKSDTLFLSSGEEVNGELLALTSAGLIFEIRRDNIFVEFKTFKKEEVLRVDNNDGKVLYDNNRLQVWDLSDFYDPPLNPFDSKQWQQGKYLFMHIVHDTLYLSDESKLVVNIQDIDNGYVSYTSLKEPGIVEKIQFDRISSVNGYPFDTYRRVFWSPPSRRFFSYPYIGVALGYGTIVTHLGTLSNSVINPDFGEEKLYFRSIDKNYGCLQLELLVHINPYLIAAVSGHYCFVFSGEVVQRSDGDKESFYLTVADVRLTYPIPYIRPWLGIGVANQSLTVISNLSGVDVVWKSRSSSVAYSAGLDLQLDKRIQPYVSTHYLPFKPKPISQYNSQKIDLSNLVISAGIKIML